MYLRQANAVKELLVESLQESPVRLAIVLKKSPVRSKASPPGCGGGGGGEASVSAVRQRRVGAFEVQVNTSATTTIVVVAVSEMFLKAATRILQVCFPRRVVRHFATRSSSFRCRNSRSDGGVD